MQPLRVTHYANTPGQPIRVKFNHPPFDTKKYDRQCRSVLGDTGALLTYAYATLHPEKTRAALAAWIKQLRDASRKQKAIHRPSRTTGSSQIKPPHNTAIEKPQASFWARASPVKAQFSKELTEGWNYRLINLTILPNQTTASWQANLIVIVECRSGRVFHHFISERRSFRLRPEQVFYVLAKVDKEMASDPLASQYANSPRSVWLPDLGGQENKTPTDRVGQVYADVLDVFNENVQLNDQVLVQWMSSPDLWINLSHWRAHSYTQTATPFILSTSITTPPSPQQTADSPRKKYQIETARQLGNSILRHTSRLDQWTSLTPHKAHERKDPERYSKTTSPKG